MAGSPGLDGGPDALIEAAEDVPDDRLRLLAELMPGEPEVF